jgi:hypothetical protein
MDSTDATTPIAWQPFTPRGVAAFARAPLVRLLVVQLIVALLAAVSVVWFLQHAWFPTIREAIERLPTEGEIRSGRLDWHGDSPATLAEGRFLALTVDLQHTGQARSPAHLQVEFGETDFAMFSLLGFWRGFYPKGWIVALNRPDALPWWEAWAPAILGLAAEGVIAALMLTWALLATLYALPVWLLGFFANRELSLGGSWRLSGAALLPGALLMSAAIFCYGSGAFDLIRLAAAMAVHLVLGWVYLISAPLRLPMVPETATVMQNPFVSSAREPTPPPGHDSHAGHQPPTASP